MLFKCYGYITMTQGLSFVSDLKLGQYMKIPPRSMFWSQTIATVLACIVQVLVLNWGLDNIPHVCDSSIDTNKFTCPGGSVFFSASIIWGLVGPGRMFSPGQVYSSLLWFFLAGALLPVATYLFVRVRPNSVAKFISFPIIFAGPGNIPPATPLNYMTWGIIGFIFNKYIRNRYRGWWSEYNYILSASLDVGLAISTLIIFFAFGMRGYSGPSWWGNNVVATTMDVSRTAISKVVPKGEHFGPSVWN
jgi:OPT family oligopeptide transporter